MQPENKAVQLPPSSLAGLTGPQPSVCKPLWYSSRPSLYLPCLCSSLTFLFILTQSLLPGLAYSRYSVINQRQSVWSSGSQVLRLVLQTHGQTTCGPVLPIVSFQSRGDTYNQAARSGPCQDHCNDRKVREQLLSSVSFSLLKNSVCCTVRVLITDIKMGQREVIRHGQSHTAIICRG